MQTLDEARDYIRENMVKGCRCPCCGQDFKVYRRLLNSGMVWFLIALSRAPKLDGGWVDIKSLDVRGGDYAKTRYWGLVEVRDNVDAAKRSSGLWRLTQLGLKFVHDQARVPKYALVLKGRCIDFSKEDVGVRQALGTKFDYGVLMSS